MTEQNPPSAGANSLAKIKFSRDGIEDKKEENELLRLIQQCDKRFDIISNNSERRIGGAVHLLRWKILEFFAESVKSAVIKVLDIDPGFLEVKFWISERNDTWSQEAALCLSHYYPKAAVDIRKIQEVAGALFSNMSDGGFSENIELFEGESTLGEDDKKKIEVIAEEELHKSGFRRLDRPLQISYKDEVKYKMEGRIAKPPSLRNNAAIQVELQGEIIGLHIVRLIIWFRDEEGNKEIVYDERHADRRILKNFIGERCAIVCRQTIDRSGRPRYCFVSLGEPHESFGDDA